MTSSELTKRIPVCLPPVSPEELAADKLIIELRRNGFAAFRVGGAIRDRLLGMACKDVDVATDAVPAAVKQIFPHAFAVGENFGVVIVHAAPGVDIEVATFRADGEYADGRRPASVHFSDLPTDAQRRDLTINALFYDPVEQMVIDPTGGLQDLRRGTIRAIGDPVQRFAEDRLRMLRCVRFAARLNFKLAPETARAIKQHASAIFDVSPERIFSELNKMLVGPAPHRALEMLSESGLLKHILPEVEALKGVQQPPEFHPEGDVWEHTILMLKNLRWPVLDLAWSVLLHDIGKPPTQSHDGQRFRFNGHCKKSEELARDIFKRLKSSRKRVKTVSVIVRNHMTFMNVPHMRRSTLRRFIAGEAFNYELELHRLDCLASHKDFSHYCMILDMLKLLAEEPPVPAPLINGQDLMKLGLKPGKKIGRWLAIIQEQQLEGKLTSRQEALQYVSKKLDSLEKQKQQ